MVPIGRRSLLAGGAALSGLGSVRARAQGNAIRIGCIAPVSGSFEVIGNPIRQGAQIAVDQINQSGGIGGRRLELVVRDDQGDPKQTIGVARELLFDDVKFFLGTPTASTVLAMKPVLLDKNGILVGCGSGDDRLSHEEFARNLFGCSTNNFTMMHGIASVMADRYPAIGNWGCVSIDVQAFQSIWSLMAKLMPAAYAAKGRKIEIIDKVMAKPGATDMKPQIYALMATKADAILSIPSGSAGLTFYEQQHQMGLEKKVKVFFDYSLDIDLPRELKANMPPIMWSRSYYAYPAWTRNKMAREVNEIYVKRTGDAVTHSLACLGHTAVMGYASAIKASGSTDTDTVIAAMEGLKFPSIRDEVYFRKEDHQLIASINIVRFAAKPGEPGWDYAELVTVPDATYVNPPAPGKKVEY